MQFSKSNKFLPVKYIFRITIPEKSANLAARWRIANAAKFSFSTNLDFGYYHAQNYKRQNEKRYKGKPNRVQSALARRIRQSCTGPPLPPSLNSCIGLLRNFVFVILQNFHKIFNFVFAKFFSHLKLFCQNFVFREILTKTFFISRNWRQISQNTK